MIATLASVLHAVLFLALLGTGLLAPGWLLGRAIGAGGGFAGALLGSSALLMNLILLLDALGVRLTAPHFGLALALLCGGLLVVSRLRFGRAAPANSSRPLAPAGPAARADWGLLAPVGVALALVLVRVTLDPLAGFDTYFRWDHLARQLVAQGTLGFYPAVTPADFRLYGWGDGIAPLVATLHAWAYWSFGRATDAAVAPVVAVQLVAVFVVVWQLAARRGGPAAGAAAVAVFATSSVALWGTSMGQETGLTALSLAALFLFLERHRADPAGRWLVWAGVAAGTGALAREYGLAFVGVGAFALAWQRTPPRGWLAFLLAAGLTAAPWYLRNWAVTGNPLWSHGLLGLFPGQPLLLEHLRIVRELGGIGAAPGLLVTLLLTLAGLPLLLGVAGAAKRGRDGVPVLLALGLVVALWLWSVGQTSGGYAYALRVLTPALALGAATSAPLVAAWIAGRHGWLPRLALALLALDAGVRSLHLPIAPHVAWWRTGLGGWRAHAELRARWRESPSWEILAQAAAGRDILVLDPSSLRRFSEAGARPVSLFSPACAFLFAPDARFETALARLRATGAKFLFLPRHDAFFDRQLSRHPFFQTLLARPPTVALPPHLVYDLDLLDVTKN